MKLLRKLLSTLLIIASPICFADGASGPGIVTGVLIYEGHAGILVQHTNMVDSDSCGRKDWYILPNTYTRFKEAYAMLLAANLANKQVAFTLSGCTDGLPKIKHISIAAG